MRLLFISCLLLASTLAQTEHDWAELAEELEMIHLLGDPVEDGETAVGGTDDTIDSFDKMLQEIIDDKPGESGLGATQEAEFAAETSRIKALLAKAGLVDSEPMKAPPSKEYYPSRSKRNQYINYNKEKSTGVFGGSSSSSSSRFGSMKTPTGYDWAYGHGFALKGSFFHEGYKSNHPPPARGGLFGGSRSSRSSSSGGGFLGRRRRN